MASLACGCYPRPGLIWQHSSTATSKGPSNSRTTEVHIVGRRQIGRGSFNSIESNPMGEWQSHSTSEQMAVDKEQQLLLTVLTTYFSLLRQQTQYQNIKEDSELDFIHTLFKKMSHPEFNKYQQLLYDTLLYHTLTIYIQRESNRCFLCSVIFLHSISRVTICKLKSHQILHEKNGLCFQ
ncbi:hypothetical protein PVAP13_1NG365919 [Panicum virgatum]|uniref:Uncharacterized protein n=1 Tax=Panicum virgatum TaxID=38727 RepID=A0A8T0XA47_PANVG|nr:hypothetical protein PVAP13_1NG365919 [Panicum virgatum]KAG2652330.1 hypothetical protein PVAP13_1NG365919 [Panicum virgatum]